MNKRSPRREYRKRMAQMPAPDPRTFCGNGPTPSLRRTYRMLIEGK